jgi:SNF2 family DNA or RNA helicase
LQEVTSGFLKIPGAEESHRIDTGKVDALREILDGLAPTEPVAIFCRFKHDLAAVHEIARELGRRSLELSGSRRELEEWQAGDGAPPILAVQEQSGGVGIDLTRAAYQIFFSTGWSFGQHDQARARMQGVKQRRNVHCIYLVALNTIDEIVHRSITRKSRNAADIVEHKVEMRQIIDVMRTARRRGKKIEEAIAGAPFFAEE